MNSLALDYPKELLEIAVVSDGSTDPTCDIVSRFVDRNVHLWHYEGRRGKTACLNQALWRASGEIVVFSDANSQYEVDAIRQLVQHLCDERVGFVTGRTIYVSAETSKTAVGIGLYSRLEQWTKMLESQIGSCIGADGAIFAIRRVLYRPLSSLDINDLVVPLMILEQGSLGRFESRALCYEKTGSGPCDEFHRQVRITNRTIRALVNHATLLNPLKFGFLSFQIFSHKVARLLVPFFLLSLFFTSLSLAKKEPLYVVFFGMQLLFYVSAWVNYTCSAPKTATQVFNLFHTFSLVSLAVLYGWYQYFKGETYVAWAPSR